MRPGDLITADLINQVLRDLADLDLRVAQSEAGAVGTAPGQVVIFEPGIGASMKVGDHLQIVGLNFGFSAAQHRVTFDELPVSGLRPVRATTCCVSSCPRCPIWARAAPRC